MDTQGVWCRPIEGYGAEEYILSESVNVYFARRPVDWEQLRALEEHCFYKEIMELIRVAPQLAGQFRIRMGDRFWSVGGCSNDYIFGECFDKEAYAHIQECFCDTLNQEIIVTIKTQMPWGEDDLYIRGKLPDVRRKIEELESSRLTILEVSG